MPWTDITDKAWIHADFFSISTLQREGRSSFQFLKEALMSKWKTIPYGMVAIREKNIFFQNSRAKLEVCIL